MFILSNYVAMLLIFVGMMSMTAYASSAPQQQEQSTLASTTNSSIHTDDTGFTVNLRRY
jgi:preprotein translocase subunit YajC